MNKIDYSTQPKEKGIDNFIWVHETKIKLAVNDNKFEKLQYYSFELNRLKTIINESKNTLRLLRGNFD